MYKENTEPESKIKRRIERKETHAKRSRKSGLKPDGNERTAVCVTGGGKANIHTRINKDKRKEKWKNRVFRSESRL